MAADLTGYYTFERVFVVSAKTRQTVKPERFQVFRGAADGALTPIASAPSGATITHLDTPVRLG